MEMMKIHDINGFLKDWKVVGMHNRPDRICYPPVDPETLWQGVSSESTPSSPDSTMDIKDCPDITSTPVIGTSPGADEPFDSAQRGTCYFKRREIGGLVTPAQTPSDILFRGPLYVGSSDEERSGRSSGSSDGSNLLTPLKLNMAGLNRAPELLSLRGGADHDQLAYHRARQEAIRESISEFTRKMTQLLDWHREQERELLHRIDVQSTRSASSEPPLRRGRSKVRERLYAAISQGN